MKDNIQNTSVIKSRFERDAAVFDAIYNTETSEFSTWFNKVFRKPIFERYDITFAAMDNLTDKSILDVGCGSGVYSIQAAMSGARRVKGIDFSQPMLDIANQRANDNHVANRCEFELVDFLQMKVSEKFDFVFAMGVFDYLIDPQPFLKKMQEAATQRVIASFPGHSLLREPLRKLRYLLTSKGRVHFYSYDDVQRLAAKMNFRRIEVKVMKTGSGFMLIADV